MTEVLTCRREWERKRSVFYDVPTIKWHPYAYIYIPLHFYFVSFVKKLV